MMYGVPMGCDFVREAACGLVARHSNPLDLAKVTVIVNGRRFARRLKDELANIVVIQPKIITVDELAPAFLPSQKFDSEAARANEALILGNMLLRLIDTSEANLFHKNHRFEIAYALLDLLDQTVEREIGPEALSELQLDDFAEHWKLNSQFFQLLTHYWTTAKKRSKMYADNEALDALGAFWVTSPHLDPVYVIGSTGSRPLMRKAMRAIAKLPVMGIVLPSVDFGITTTPPADHPQFGLRDLCAHLDLDHVDLWSGQERPFAGFVKLALAPAPATDQWRAQLGFAKSAIQNDNIKLSFIEAKSRHEEASALSVCIHQAVSNSQKVALVSSDRLLVRALCHRLDELQIVYDDSSGTPLSLTPEGLLLRMILDFESRKTPLDLLPLLGHPHVAKATRTNHLKQLRYFEQKILRRFPGLDPWRATVRSEDPEFTAWASHWQAIIEQPRPVTQSFAAWLGWHIARFTQLTGEDAQSSQGINVIFSKMRAISDGEEPSLSMSFDDYARFWQSWIAREKAQPEEMKIAPDVKVLGTIEARAECADMVIQAGMNEGLWPSPSIPDMWLNRELREKLGLETPERFVGLAAHDFISGMATKHWVISHSTQLDGAQTIESRFVTRMKTLLQGADVDFYEDAQKRGLNILKTARALDIHEGSVTPTSRPAVLVPVDNRPRAMSATQLEKYVKNPYRFYVENTLGLMPVNTLSDEVGASVKGEVWHKVFENYTLQYPAPAQFDQGQFYTIFKAEIDACELDDLAQFNFEFDYANLMKVFASEETERRDWANQIHPEHWIEKIEKFGDFEMLLKAKIDRIDIGPAAAWRVYDYKSGSSAPFSAATIKVENTQQVQFSAHLIRSKFGDNFDQAGVIRYKPDVKGTGLVEYDPEEFERDLSQMFAAYFDATREWQVNPSDRFADELLHFARYGEWLDDAEAQIVELVS